LFGFLLLRLQWSGILKIVAFLINLCYTLIYKENLSEKFLNSTQALNNLMKVENHFMRLIEISELLITKYEKGRKMREEPFTISKTYLKELLTEAENV
jgi:hypothetical protein